MKLNEVDFPALLSAALRDDHTARCLAETLNPYLKDLTAAADDPQLLPRVDDLEETVLDELACELCIRWYDTLAPLEAKRAVVAQSDLVHRGMGTPSAIERVVSAFLGSMRVEEWWEYDGEPYHFRVRTTDIDIALAKNADIHRVVAQTQNLRSVYDGIRIETQTGTAQAYVGAAIQTAQFITLPTIRP